MKQFPFSRLAIALTGVLSTSVLASDDVERILVTSDFREQRLQQYPASITVVDAAKLQEREARHLEDVLNMAPNLNFSSGASRGRFVQVRGIGERSQFIAPVYPSVGLVLDGVDLSSLGGAATLYDIEQVEVLRGPQGTRFGTGALAGMLALQSVKPSKDTQGKLDLTLAQDNTWALGGAIGGGITDNLQYRVAANQYTSDGWTENKHLNRDDTQDKDELTLRGQLAYQATSNLHFELGMNFIDIDNGYDAFSLDNQRSTLSDNPGHDRLKTRAWHLNSQYKGSSFADMSLLLSYASADSEYGYDEDWVYEGFHPWGYNSTDNYLRAHQNIGADFRLTGKHKLFNGSTDWVVGMSYRDDDVDLRRQYTYLDEDYISENRYQTLSLYAELTSQLSDKLALTYGFRVEQAEIDFAANDGFSAKPDEDLLGGRLVLSYALSENHQLYVSANRGYKLGGVNTNTSLDASLRTYDAEYLWNYEAGIKSSLLNNTAYVRISGFYMDRQDQQLTAYLSQARDDGSNAFIDYTDNADKGQAYGIELESSWQITDNWQIEANLAWLNGEFDDLARQLDDDSVVLVDRENAQSPDYQFYVASRYDFSDKLWLLLSIEGKDDFYLSNTHDNQSDSFELFNLRLTYELGEVALSLWGNNIFNQDYYVRGFEFGNDPRNGYESTAYYQYGQPSLWGVSASYQF